MYSYMDALTLPHFGGGLCAGILAYFVFKFIYANFYKENFIARCNYSVRCRCGGFFAVAFGVIFAGIGSQAFPFSAVSFCHGDYRCFCMNGGNV